MTIFKPFGYSDVRTVLQMVTFWGWLFFGLVLHYLKYKRCRKPPAEIPADVATKATETLPGSTISKISPASSSIEDETRELSESSRSGNEGRGNADIDIEVGGRYR